MIMPMCIFCLKERKKMERVDHRIEEKRHVTSKADNCKHICEKNYEPSAKL